MRLAVIDLGTNSVRFDIFLLLAGRPVELIHREKLMVKLGEKVFLTRRLNPKARKRTLQAFLRFRQSAREHQVDRICAFGTSALREAVNAGSFIREVREKSGIRIRTLSGTQEARLIARGILANEPRAKGRVALLDIGGGSTELSFCRHGRIRHSFSLPLGSARLQQLFPIRGGHRLAPFQAARLRQHVQRTLRSHLKSSDFERGIRLLGSSGTVRAISRLMEYNEGTETITRRVLQRWIEQLLTLNRKEMLRVPGMEAKRADFFMTGAILLDEIMGTIGTSRIRPTEFSLRHGIIEEER